MQKAIEGSFFIILRFFFNGKQVRGVGSMLSFLCATKEQNLKVLKNFTED